MAFQSLNCFYKYTLTCSLTTICILLTPIYVSLHLSSASEWRPSTQPTVSLSSRLHLHSHVYHCVSRHSRDRETSLSLRCTPSLPVPFPPRVLVSPREWTMCTLVWPWLRWKVVPHSRVHFPSIGPNGRRMKWIYLTWLHSPSLSPLHCHKCTNKMISVISFVREWEKKRKSLMKSGLWGFIFIYDDEDTPLVASHKKEHSRGLSLNASIHWVT